MTRLRQEWKVALVVVAIAAIAFAFGLYLVRDVDTDLGVTPTNVHEEPAP